MLRLLTSLLTVAPLVCCSSPAQPLWPAALQRHAESLAGARAAAELEETCGGVVCCPGVQERLDRIAVAVAAHCGTAEHPAWQIKILRSEQPNAFALPHRIYLTHGLYQRIGQDDALIAAAIAHEMAHIQQRDCFKPDCTTASESLAREQAADRLALRYLKLSAYPPESLARLLRIIADAQPEGWTDARVRSLAAAF